ncbi:MAG: amidohydrolase [Clostridia bacterium]|nr:amidohydrolase [Clostridia bacterium]
MKQIYINGNVITMDKSNSKANAFVVSEGIFTEVGDAQRILEQSIPDAEVIDLKGATVVPGFNDSHLHLLNYAYGKTKIDLSYQKSTKEVIDSAKKYIADKDIPRGKWVVGTGWNEYFYPDKHILTRDDLDQISTEHPIVFTRNCVHTVVVNSLALEIIGITNETPNPPGGLIRRDSTGVATGLLNENARYLAYDKLPDASETEIKDMLDSAMQELASYGLTSLQTDDFETFSSKNYEIIINAYKALTKEGRMSARIYEQCLLPSIDRLHEFFNKGYKTGYGDSFFKIGPLKLLVDGSIGPHTAFLSEEYSDDPGNFGVCQFTQKELDELIFTAQENQTHVLCHNIGDAAMTRTLNSYEKALEKFKNPDARNGIVHIQISTFDILKRIKDLHVVAYAEPICIDGDMHCVEDRVGQKRLLESYAYKTMLDLGLKCGYSSDSPVDPVNPIMSAYIATNRKDHNGWPKDGWYPEQKLTIEEVLEGFTMGSAYCSFEENVKGSIAKGKYADFVILSENILETPIEDLLRVFVVKTFLGGKQTYPPM